MIKRYLVVFYLSLLSCHGHQLSTEEKDSQDAIDAIIEAAVLQDSLDLTTPIAKELMPYVYFPHYLDDNEIEIPPPSHTHSGIHHVNELLIAKNFEYTSLYQLTKLDTLHIKEQLLYSKPLSVQKLNIHQADIFSIEAAKKPSGRKVKKCYIFSMPLFSADSAVVYVQYDYLPVDVTAHGSFIILAKLQDKWKKIGGGPTWMQ